MARNTFALFGILTVLLLGIGMVFAASGSVIENGITLTVNETALTNVTTGEVYAFEVTVENANGTDYNVSFGTSGWNWDKSGVTVANGSTETFVGTLTIGTTQSKSVIAKFYDMSNSSQMLFDVSKSVSLSYYEPTPEPTQGCTTVGDGNYTDADVHNESFCTGIPPTQSSDTWCGEDFTNGEIGDLRIIDVDVTNNGQGDDDLWGYLDDIEIEITIENTNDDESIDDVIVEIEIRDSGNNVYTKKDFNIDDDKEDVGKIGKDGDEESVIFTIDELPTDLDEGTYKIYVRAYEDNHGDEQCSSKSDDLENDDNDETYFEFEIEATQDSTVIVSNNLDNIQAYCGEKNVEVTFKVHNIGSDKEEKVLVNLYNSALGISEYKVIDDLKDGGSKEITFFVDIPEELAREYMEFDIFTFYDYDDDDDELEIYAYDEGSSNEGDDFAIGLQITSCAAPAPSVNANLDSSAEVGEELVIKALITNSGKDNSFAISASGFELWADLISVTPQTTSINEDEFVEVTVVLKPHTAGTQSFTIDTIVDGESHSQAISVKIDEKSDEGLFGMNKNMTYIFIGIIALVILIFLVLIAKISRKSEKPQF